MKPLILIRHAEAEHHIRAITGGWTDSVLTERGRREAHLLGGRLRGELAGIPLTLACSDLKRGVQTAEIIGAALGLVPIPYPELRDLNNGVAAGKTHAEARQYAIAPHEPLIDWQPYPHAESWRQLFTRITGFMDAYSQDQDSAAILVTHAAVIHVIIAWWLKLGVEHPSFFELAPASLTVLTTNRWNEAVVERLNDTAHLYAAGLAEPLRL